MQPYKAISVVGPTASGKSALADRLALRLGGEVVSADSMQVYRGMDIGTAKTPVEERPVPLHCVDLVDMGEPYSAAVFAGDAHRVIDELLAQGKVPIVCGGTGLYVRAANEDMGFPAGEQVQNVVREHYEAVAEQMGAEAFHAMLAERDPQSAALIHYNNVRRVVRAFELLEQGSSYAREHETLHVRQDRYPTLHVGLTMPRDLLYERINRRVDVMVQKGLFDEVKGLVQSGLGDTMTARQAIGYKELIDVLEGTKTFEAAIEEIKQSSRRYAKRQYTWFNQDKRIVWFDITQMTTHQIDDEVCTMFAQGIAG